MSPPRATTSTISGLLMAVALVLAGCSREPAPSAAEAGAPETPTSQPADASSEPDVDRISPSIGDARSAMAKDSIATEVPPTAHQIGDARPGRQNAEVREPPWPCSPDDLSYGFVRKYLSVRDLPRLYSILEDPTMAARWRGVVRTIGYICYDVEHDDQPAEMLLRYIRRRDDWGSPGATTAISMAMDKRSALHWLGLIGGDLAVAALREALTEEGAAQLVWNWDVDHFSAEWREEDAPGALVDMVRGTAALGLVLTRSPENIQLVQEVFAVEDVRARSLGSCAGGFYSLLVDAMAHHDFAEERGFEEYLRLSSEDPAWLDTIGPFLLKYVAWDPAIQRGIAARAHDRRRDQGY